MFSCTDRDDAWAADQQQGLVLMTTHLELRITFERFQACLQGWVRHGTLHLRHLLLHLWRLHRLLHRLETLPHLRKHNLVRSMHKQRAAAVSSENHIVR